MNRFRFRFEAFNRYRTPNDPAVARDNIIISVVAFDEEEALKKVRETVDRQYFDLQEVTEERPE